MLNQIKESNNPNIHKQLKTPLHEAINKLSKADSERAVKNSVEDNKYYNSFIHQASQYQSYGIYLEIKFLVERIKSHPYGWFFYR
ncbi:hypothetical protein ACU42Y_15995 [Proteus mirabilis]